MKTWRLSVLCPLHPLGLTFNPSPLLLVLGDWSLGISELPVLQILFTFDQQGAPTPPCLYLTNEVPFIKALIPTCPLFLPGH